MAKHVGHRGPNQRRQIVPRDSGAFAATPRGPDRRDEFTIKSNRGSRGKNGGFYEKSIIAFDSKGVAIYGLFCFNPKRVTNPALPA